MSPLGGSQLFVCKSQKRHALTDTSIHNCGHGIALKFKWLIGVRLPEMRVISEIGSVRLCEFHISMDDCVSDYA